MKYEQHQLGKLLPALKRDEYRELRENIRQNGQMRPAEIFEGKILDGWHRYLVAEEIGIDLLTVPFEGTQEAAVSLISADTHRRTINASQRAMVFAGLTNYRQRLEDEARKRQGTRTDLLATLPKSDPVHAHVIAATAARVSPRTMQDALTLVDHGTPEQIEAVKSGAKPVNVAADEVRAAQPPKPPRTIPAKPPRVAFTLEQWKAMSADERLEAMETRNAGKMNNTADAQGIEWADWSWNPITGCEHGCPYCYARDLAEKFTDAFPNGFTPTFIPERLGHPGQTKLPEVNTPAEAPRRHVFTCSMSDMFGAWVPREWIMEILNICAGNLGWTFLVLTKYPRRAIDFDFPDNVLVGATVDIQSRVKPTEAAFEKMKAKVKWVSVEPMLQPIKFNRPELFQWYIIGGSSRSSQTPEWVPPMDWVCALHDQARAAGAEVFHKRHLGFPEAMRSRSFPWYPQPQRTLPSQFEYWKKATP